jgi:hypothetical protein
MPINPVEKEPNIAPAENVVIRRDRRDANDQQNIISARTQNLQELGRSQRAAAQENRVKIDTLEQQRTQERNDAAAQVQQREVRVRTENNRKNGGMGTNMDILG